MRTGSPAVSLILSAHVRSPMPLHVAVTGAVRSAVAAGHVPPTSHEDSVQSTLARIATSLKEPDRVLARADGNARPAVVSASQRDDMGSNTAMLQNTPVGRCRGAYRRQRQ